VEPNLEHIYETLENIQHNVGVTVIVCTIYDVNETVLLHVSTSASVKTVSSVQVSLSKEIIPWSRGLFEKPVQGSLSLGVERPWREADHSPPSSVEVKNAWRYTSTPIRLHGVVFS
jgi:hypothetical protein